MSTAENILNALQHCLLNAAPCMRNAALPESITGDGLIIIRDGTPSLHDVTLGGMDACYYSHEIPAEVYVQDSDAEIRDHMFDEVLMRIGDVLDADLTLGERAYGLTYSRPTVEVEPIEGAPAIKHGILNITVEYAAPSPLR